MGREYLYTYLSSLDFSLAFYNVARGRFSSITILKITPCILIESLPYLFL